MKHVWMEDDHECAVVYSYHPMYFTRGKENAPAILAARLAARELLFNANIAKAANALCGHTMIGNGMEILRNAVQTGCSVPDAIDQYLPPDLSNITPASVIKELEELGLLHRVSAFPSP